MLTAAPALFPIVDAQHTRRAAMDAIVERRFAFNGEEYQLGPGFDWTANPSKDLEWLILLHKFYYAAGLGAAWQETGDRRYLDTWMELTESWIHQVPHDFLPSDVAGRRIQNWISAWQYFSGDVPEAFARRFQLSLTQQAEWLRENLTPARNHRTLELLALFLAGLALERSDWLSFAREELVANLRTDLRPDGVHCEQSTDYHHIVLRNALVVARLARMNGIAMPDGFDDLLRSALEFALWIHRPDGLIPSLSDGDTASYLGLLEQGYELFGDRRYQWAATKGQKGRPPAERAKAFPNGGYYILRSGWGERERFEDERFLVFDCGPLGEGNHGHFDLLSFEMYGNGQPLIVDPGRYTYDESGEVNWRALFRGTASHNTIVVDGRNQTRYEFHKRKFKVRGPEPAYALLGFGEREGLQFVRGRAQSHEYDVVHEREIRLVDGVRFVIVDELASPSEHTYEQTFHLAPGAERRLRITQSIPAGCVVENGWVAQAYGIKESAPVMKYVRRGSCVRFETTIEVLS